MARLLVVDDEPDILLMLRVSLEAAGYETVLAADGDVALQRIREEDFDLVLLDVMMPALDGWGVLETLRDRAGAPPVVVLSAKAAERDVAHAHELGAREYLTKPFDIEVLLKSVERTIRGSSQGDETLRDPSQGGD